MTLFERRLVQLKRRLIREAGLAIEMLERSLNALRGWDREAAGEVRRVDDEVDLEEVEIEQEAYRLMTLEQPVAADFRMLAFILRANGAVERVADHASSIAKILTRMDGERPPVWPASLLELSDRVPVMCHVTMRAVLNEDVQSAQSLVSTDEIVDDLDRQLFQETAAMIRDDPDCVVNGLHIYRIGRELERVGDLMTSIAEDLVFLVTGRIIRHAKRRPIRPTQ
ncbi:MAG: phosphate signaling complex protein PhoU [Phycisphaeraceae bacterium]|nr:phosphate signaling complex protein PhoU [Phycisphaeraceae bacterium]